jgi:isopropylmalate/homocitrate/citramalate synthase
MRYVYRDGDWRNPATNEPMDVPDTPAVPYIASDIKPYRSMVSGKMIDGRAAQREDLKQSGCRVADPSEWKIETARTKKWADRFKVDHVPDKGPERLAGV